MEKTVLLKDDKGNVYGPIKVNIETVKYESYIIRIYDQDLCSDWIDRGSFKTPNNYINRDQLFQDLQDHGLKILNSTFDQIGACYLIEVKGSYSGEIVYEIV